MIQWKRNNVEHDEFKCRIKQHVSIREFLHMESILFDQNALRLSSDDRFFSINRPRRNLIRISTDILAVRQRSLGHLRYVLKWIPLDGFDFQQVKDWEREIDEQWYSATIEIIRTRKRFRRKWLIRSFTFFILDLEQPWRPFEHWTRNSIPFMSNQISDLAEPSMFDVVEYEIVLEYFQDQTKQNNNIFLFQKLRWLKCQMKPMNKYPIGFINVFSLKTSNIARRFIREILFRFCLSEYWKILITFNGTKTLSPCDLSVMKIMNRWKRNYHCGKPFIWRFFFFWQPFHCYQPNTDVLFVGHFLS